MAEPTINQPVPVQEQQAAKKASTHPNFPDGLDIPGHGVIPVHSTGVPEHHLTRPKARRKK